MKMDYFLGYLITENVTVPVHLALPQETGGVNGALLVETPSLHVASIQQQNLGCLKVFFPLAA
jgi:hypothetical protein